MFSLITPLRSLCCLLSLAAAFSLGARAEVPKADAAKDQLDLPIQGLDVYELPSGKTVYHGTFRTFPKFLDPTTLKMGHPRYNARNNATWFGADKNTSEAMGFFRYCQEALPLARTLKAATEGLAKAKGNKDAVTKALAALKKDHIKTAALDPDYWPKLMSVKVNKALHFILVPHGAEGHQVALKKIGFNWNLPIKSLYGVGSDKGMEVMQKSNLCKAKLKVKAGKISSDHDAKEEELYGWRAPWDQNELAVCSTAFVKGNANADPFVVESTEVLAKDVQSELEKAFAHVKDLAVHGDKLKLSKALTDEAEKEGGGEQAPMATNTKDESESSEVEAVAEVLEKDPKPMTAYVDAFSTAVTKLCNDKKTKQENVQNGGAFDIWFAK